MLTDNPTFKKRYTLKELKKKIREIEDYLGPKLNYSFDNWSQDRGLRLLMESNILLKERYYKRKKVFDKDG